MMPAAAPSAFTQYATSGVGSGPGISKTLTPGAQEHGDDFVVEGLRADASVTPDDDAAIGVDADLGEPGDDALGGASHGVAVHPRRSGHDGTAQTGGAEGERRVESTVQLLFVPVVQQLLQGLAVLDVGVAVDPAPDLVAQRRVHKTGMTCVNNVPSDAAADWPASSTSRWFRWPAVTPAAWFDTRLNPSTSAPR